MDLIHRNQRQRPESLCVFSGEINVAREPNILLYTTIVHHFLARARSRTDIMLNTQFDGCYGVRLG